MPLLTIGTATFRDFFGLWPMLVEINDIASEMGFRHLLELLVVDNEPNGPHGKHNKALCDQIDARYVPFGEEVGTSAPRNKVFAAATGDFVLCGDSHIRLRHGVLPRLVGWCQNLPRVPSISDGEPDYRDLFQGPLMNYSGRDITWTHWAEAWGSNGMLGKQRANPKLLDPATKPLPIGMAGLGLFLAHRESWLGFSPDQQHFGGEEGYIHEKYRIAGRKCWCLGFLQWQHRFRLDRDAEPIDFPTDWYSRAWNMLLGYRDHGWPSLQEIKAIHVNGETAMIDVGTGAPRPVKTSGRLSTAEWDQLLHDMRLSESETIAPKWDHRRIHQPQPQRPAAPTPIVSTDELLKQLPCEHRGPQMALVQCDLCGAGKGQSFPAYECNLHGGICTLEKKRQSVRSCRQCLATSKLTAAATGAAR